MILIHRDTNLPRILFTGLSLILLSATAYPQRIIHTCPGGSVELSTDIPGIGYQWSPEQGIAFPSLSSTTAKVNATSIYVCTIYQVLDNLIVNPHFNLGNQGFLSDYSYNPSAQSGRYYLTDQRTDSWWNGFSPCFDHTTGQDSMLLVDGASVPDARVWCQDIRVQPNTTYAFSCWIQNICTCGAPPRLQFAINGVKLGSDFLVTTTNCLWTQFYELWNSGSDTLASICILNQNLNPDGNDFALDDIGFQAIQIAYDTIRVITDIALPVGHQTIGLCPGSTFNFNGHTYDQPGFYADTLRGLPSCDSIVMTLLEQVEFAIEAGDPREIENGNSIQLLVEAPDLSNLQWSWSPADQLSCADCPIPEASPATSTTYHVTVTDPTTGCTAIDEVRVQVVPCRKIYFPNAFTPNDDGINDLYVPITGSCVKSIRVFRILDRWGNILFELENVSGNQEGWDGTYHGMASPSGVYIYQAWIEFGNGTTSWLTGDVTLVR